MSTEQSESTTQLPAQPPGEAGAQQPPGAPPEQPAEWGAPPPPAAPKSKWTAKRIVIAVVVAVGIAAAGGAAIWAASGSVDNSQNGPGGGPGGNGPVRIGGPMFGDDQAQHGEFQLGEITAVSDDSVTVKSEDGYEKTYVIDSDTQKSGDLAKGTQVNVTATTANGTTTAKSVMALGDFSNRRNGDQGGPRSGMNPPNGGN
jgi:hypothetical protein